MKVSVSDTVDSAWTNEVAQRLHCGGPPGGSVALSLVLCWLYCSGLGVSVLLPCAWRCCGSVPSLPHALHNSGIVGNLLPHAAAAAMLGAAVVSLPLTQRW